MAKPLSAMIAIKTYMQHPKDSSLSEDDRKVPSSQLLEFKKSMEAEEYEELGRQAIEVLNEFDGAGTYVLKS